MTFENKTVLLAEHSPPSSLVTDESKRAWLARETRLANLSVAMFDFIMLNTPTAQEVAAHFSNEDSLDVSDCLWRLLDELFIEITKDRKLQVIGTD